MYRVWHYFGASVSIHYKVRWMNSAQTEMGVGGDESEAWETGPFLMWLTALLLLLPWLTAALLVSKETAEHWAAAGCMDTVLLWPWILLPSDPPHVDLVAGGFPGKPSCLEMALEREHRKRNISKVIHRHTPARNEIFCLPTIGNRFMLWPQSCAEHQTHLEWLGWGHGGRMQE